MRRIRSPCCARAASGHDTAAPPSDELAASNHSITSSPRSSGLAEVRLAPESNRVADIAEGPSGLPTVSEVLEDGTIVTYSPPALHV